MQINIKKVQKPARYSGGEYGSIVKTKQADLVRFAFCFPEVYDVGMSHLGLKILYSLINSVDNYWCERAFMPMPDMLEEMRNSGQLLWGLESGEPVKNCDFLGFTLQYELTYTNLLAMLELAGIPLLSSERGADLPIVIAGGLSACNPLPLADFIDLFVIGDGEEVTLALLQLYEQCKALPNCKEVFLSKACTLEGVYVPLLYKSGQIVKRTYIRDLSKMYFPERFVLPFCEVVHDRAVVEVLRGCIRGCRFCQAGFICRPYREKPLNTIIGQATALCENGGFDEMSLSSLSTGDYSEIVPLLTELTDYTNERGIGLSLPSLRADKFQKEVLDQIKQVRKSGLTFAPEAGTQRLRDVINKNVTEEEILDSMRIAFEGGYTSVKLYFMIGLPTETDEDILGIKTLCEKIIDLYYTLPKKGFKAVSISVSLSTFIPKPFTPFEFEPLISREEVDRRQKLLLSVLTNRKVKVSWSDYDTSLLEASLARGDRKLGAVIASAYRNGAILDGWGEHFKFSAWEQAFAEHNLSMADYVRNRDYEEPLPWDFIDMRVSKDFLISENKLAHKAERTPNCREQCSNCGADCGGVVEVVPLVKGIALAERKAVERLPVEEYNTVQIYFSKVGRAKYISHLDLDKTFRRAIARSKLACWSTEGFNKHVYINFPLPLSLGVESLREMAEIRVEKALPAFAIKQLLSDAFDTIDGIDILEVVVNPLKHGAVTKAEYVFEFNTEIDFTSFFAQEEITVKKKTKKGKRKVYLDYNIKPYIEVIAVEPQKLTAVLQVSPNLLMTALENYNSDKHKELEATIIRTKYIM